MNWTIPEDIKKEIDSLDLEKKEKVLKYIMRESEVGGHPSREELLEIIRYLKGKSLKEGKIRNLPKNFPGTNISLEKEKQPKEYLQIFNCTFCAFSQKGYCKKQDSFLFNQKINEKILCNLYEEHI